MTYRYNCPDCAQYVRSDIMPDALHDRDAFDRAWDQWEALADEFIDRHDCDNDDLKGTCWAS